MSNNGKYGERRFSQIMKGKGYEVIDVTGNPDYFYKDIDFIITSPTSGLTKTFEVKYDTKINSTGNLYLELTNVHSKNGIGWYNFIEADLLAYGNAARGLFYIIPVAELKKRVEELPKRYSSCGTDSIGLLVNLNDIKDLITLL